MAYFKEDRMKKKNKKRSLKDIKRDLKNLENSIEIKSELITGITAGIVVLVAIDLKDKLGNYGFKGTLAYTALFLICLFAYGRKEKKKFKELEKEIQSSKTYSSLKYKLK